MRRGPRGKSKKSKQTGMSRGKNKSSKTSHHDEWFFHKSIEVVEQEPPRETG
jgi:hypothetical protein